MTIIEITTALSASGKAVQRRQIYNFIKTLGIAPLGARQRPQQYPPDTAAKILNHLGITPTASGKTSKPAARFASLKTFTAARPMKKQK